MAEKRQPLLQGDVIHPSYSQALYLRSIRLSLLFILHHSSFILDV
jgi:hypothetical protein